MHLCFGNQKMSRPSSAAAMTLVRHPIEDEIENLKNENQRLASENQSNEEFLIKIRESNAKKDELIIQLESQLSKMETRKRAEILLSEEESRTRSLEDSHSIRILTLERDRLRDELKIYSKFEIENGKLRETILSLQNQIEKLEKMQERESQKNKIDLTEYRRLMDSEFRKKAKELEEELREKIYREINNEAKQAIVGNVKLQDMIQKQNRDLEDVLDRLKFSEESGMKLVS